MARRSSVLPAMAVALGPLLAGPAAAQCVGMWRAAETGPSARQNHAMAYDDEHGVVVLFGGFGSGPGFLADTWEFGDSGWSQSADSGPPARGNHAMTYDPQRGKVILFGGAGPGGATYDDTWEYDVATNTWTELLPAASPTGRFNHAMTHDALNHEIVLFGGFSTALLDDTWAFRDGNWVQLAAGGCPARSGHAMTFDATNNAVLLFGGFNGARLGDTWQWNGTAWTQLASSGPPGRHYLSLAYHAECGRVILFGGQTGTCADCREDDTWSWDGQTWVQIGEGQVSPGRDQHAMAYHAALGEIVVFGGCAGSNSVLADTWTWKPNCGGDVNGDQRVDLGDLATLLPNFGLVGATWMHGDVDGDGDVDLGDLALLLMNFGATCL